MSQLDTYRNTLLRKRGELARLNQDLAREQSKLAPLQSKINSTESAIRRTKSASTIRSKLSEIERASKSVADVQKKIGEIQKKIANKEKEIATAEKHCQNEEAKVRKKQADEEKKRMQAAAQQSKQLEQRLLHNERIQAQMQYDIEQLQAVPETITVLFLAANPIDTPALRLDEEARSIQEKIRLSAYRDCVRFESRWATRASDILQAINETNPTIVHFSGHGAGTGELALLNPDGSTKLVTKEAISMAMSTASDTIRLVVFNACFSEIQAQAVVDHIDSAIGISTSIGDEAACVFAAQLYSSIGFGRSLQISFKQAIAALMLEGIPEDDTPQLHVKDGINPDDIVLVTLQLLTNMLIKIEVVKSRFIRKLALQQCLLTTFAAA